MSHTIEDEMEKEFTPGFHRSVTDAVIKSNHGDWIPVSERLPEQDGLLAIIEDDIGKELKLLRKSRRITQEAMGIYLAKQLGKDKPIIKTQIYSYECGKNRITFPIFIGWCKVCDANPVEVLNKVVGNIVD